MRTVILLMYNKILGVIYRLTQRILIKINDRLLKLSKEKESNDYLLKHSSFKKDKILIITKIKKNFKERVNFFNYINFNNVNNTYSYCKKQGVSICRNFINNFSFFALIIKKNTYKKILPKFDKKNSIDIFSKLQSPSITINKLFKGFYLLGLTYLSLYFFLGGYNDYNTSVKKFNIESEILQDNENVSNISNISDNFKDNLEESLPYSISKFKSELKKYSWILKKDNNLPFNNTQVAVLMNRMIDDNYDLDKVSFTKKVPGFFVDELPEDISVIKDIETRKKVFISIVLPLVVETNRNIALKRNRLIKLYEKLQNSKTLTLGEHNWLINLAAAYSIETRYIHKITIAKNLLKHIDIIPNSIAIAQAAKESGWGTSRFAKEGNALFGQWTFDNSKGLLPTKRDKGQEHLVKSFDNLAASVVSYMDNINSHKAYDSFREIRSEFRINNKPLNSIILVHELSSYAELPNYTQVLQLIIEKNKLYMFDNIELIDKDSIV